MVLEEIKTLQMAWIGLDQFCATFLGTVDVEMIQIKRHGGDPTRTIRSFDHGEPHLV